MHIIIYQGSLYKFNNLYNELENIFIDRCWFIVKNIQNNENFEYIEKISHIWANIKYLNVDYDNNIIDEINKLVFH